MSDIPASVLAKPRGSLVAVATGPEVVLYLRDDAFGLKRYPSQGCTVDLRLGTWELDRVTLAALILRLARSDATTFDHHLDVSTPPAVRLLQCLVGQNQIDIHIVTETIARSFRIANPVRLEAGYLVNRLRSLPAWSPDEYRQALVRLTKLYPTAHALWWASLEQEA